MIGFEYYNPAKIVFGEDSEKKLKSLLSQHKVYTAETSSKHWAFTTSSLTQ